MNMASIWHTVQCGGPLHSRDDAIGIITYSQLGISVCTLIGPAGGPDNLTHPGARPARSNLASMLHE